MSRITDCFAALKHQNRTALVTFITAGDPQPSMTAPLMQTLVEQGADILELGVPFSDPMADGPVIQRASERALAQNTSLRDVLDIVREFRSQNLTTPVVLMGYLNPIEIMGYQHFAAAAQEAGVDGVLTVDLPPEEGHEFIPVMQQHELDPIYLLAPTSTPERIQRITGSARGFVYYVSLKGVTGAAHLDVQSVADKLAQIRTMTALPVGVGFGVKDAATAKAMAQIADAVVVGSAIVSQIERLVDEPSKMHEAIGELVRAMRTAMDQDA